MTAYIEIIRLSFKCVFIRDHHRADDYTIDKIDFHQVTPIFKPNFNFCSKLFIKDFFDF